MPELDAISLTGLKEHHRKDQELPEYVRKYTGVRWVWELEKKIREEGLSEPVENLIDSVDVAINADNFRPDRFAAMTDKSVRCYLANAPFSLVLGFGVIYRDKESGQELRLSRLLVGECAQPERFVVEGKNQDGEAETVALGQLFAHYESVEQEDFTSPASPLLPEKFRMFYDLVTEADLTWHLEAKGADQFLSSLMVEHFGEARKAS